MRKGFLIVLAVVLVAALAAPAVAGTDINGFYRAKAWMSNFKNAGSDSGGNPIVAKDAPTSAYVEQRLRLKFTSGEENVKAVAFFEIDFSAWGDSAGYAKNGGVYGTGSATTGSNDTTAMGAHRNTGGALGGDRINLETKNVYVWFKLPNTSLDFTVGLQNQSDAYAGIIFGGADMAGIFVNGKMDPVSYTLGWAKLYENNTAKADDMTLYVAAAKFAPTKDVKVGLNLYYLQDDTAKLSSVDPNNSIGQLPGDPVFAASTQLGFNKKRIYTPGVDFSFNAGPATLSGFAFAQFGKFRDFVAANDNLADIKVSGFAADLRADLNLGPGKAFLEGLYISGGDNNSVKYKSIVTLSDVNGSPGGNSAYGRTDMSILLFNGDDINTSQALVGTASGGPTQTSPGNGGRGLWHVAAGYSQKLGDKLTCKVGAGYLAAAKLLLSEVSSKKGKGMGTEINANVNYNIMKGLDFGLYGAYAWFGDFYKDKAGVLPDPDNGYETHARLNYAF